MLHIVQHRAVKVRVVGGMLVMWRVSMGNLHVYVDSHWMKSNVKSICGAFSRIPLDEIQRTARFGANM